MIQTNSSQCLTDRCKHSSYKVFYTFPEITFCSFLSCAQINHIVDFEGWSCWWFKSSISKFTNLDAKTIKTETRKHELSSVFFGVLAEFELQSFDCRLPILFLCQEVWNKLNNQNPEHKFRPHEKMLTASGDVFSFLIYELGSHATPERFTWLETNCWDAGIWILDFFDALASDENFSIIAATLGNNSKQDVSFDHSVKLSASKRLKWKWHFNLNDMKSNSALRVRISMSMLWMTVMDVNWNGDASPPAPTHKQIKPSVADVRRVLSVFV